jgi:cell pole-organizing protein PopZ
MLQERTIVHGILGRMREIIADGPPPADLQKTAVRATELHDIGSAAPVPDVVSPTFGVAPLVRPDEPQSSQPAISLEAVFASAIRDGISPSFTQRWVNSHQAELIDALGPIFQRWMDKRLPQHFVNSQQAELIDALGPIFRRWMDEYLPKLVESILREEFSRRTQLTGRE